MKSMIDELWYGNVSPMDDTRNNTEETPIILVDIFFEKNVN